MNINKFEFPREAHKLDTWIEFLSDPKKYAKLQADLNAIKDDINKKLKDLNVGRDVNKSLEKAQTSAREAASIVDQAKATKEKWEVEEGKEKKLQTAKRGELTRREKKLEADIAEFAKQREQISQADAKTAKAMAEARIEVQKEQQAAVEAKKEYQSKLAEFKAMSERL